MVTGNSQASASLAPGPSLPAGTGEWRKEGQAACRWGGPSLGLPQGYGRISAT